MNVNQLPQYKCHKVVRAGKISEIDIITEPDLTGEGRPEPAQGAFLSFDNYPPVTVTADFVSRHQPQVGGYLVAYEDGYLSYSPADVFEAGYHELPPLGTACGGTADAAPANTGFEWRKKPVVIEAYQWKEGDSLNLRGKGWPQWLVAATRCSGDYAGQIVTQSFEGYATIKTLEGDMRADIGDWIIRGVKGELYPCKQDIFAATYEPADTAPATNMVGATGGHEALPSWVGVDLAAADFSDALMWLKEGKRVQRAGWNGAGQWVEMAGETPANVAKHLILKNAQGLFVPGWTASTGDLLATDWKVVTD